MDGQLTSPATTESHSEPLLLQETRADATRWLAAFSPLLDPPEKVPLDACRKRLDALPNLRSDGQRLLFSLQTYHAPDDTELVNTLQEAVGQLESIERDLRARLGDPATAGASGAGVDLASLRAKLAEREARHEVEALTPVSSALHGRPLELRTGSGNPGGALFMGVFAFAWLSFTTVHASIMIGGMMHAFGPLALGLLAFYSIFFLAGGGMAWAALRALMSERVVVEGRQLSVRRELFGRSWVREYAMGPESRAEIVQSSTTQRGQRFTTEINVVDAEGRDVRFASGRPAAEQKRLVHEINAYLGQG